MSQGLVIGKFMPLHTGHIALIEFAATRCDELIVLVSAHPDEPIPGHERLKWLWQTFRHNPNIHIEYTEEDLPDAPVSSRSVSQVWAGFLSRKFPAVSVLFSSETYGEFLAEYMDIQHHMFDLDRTQTPVSARDIRSEPFKNWALIPRVVKPYFQKKICVYGAESTGKSTLTEDLARHFETGYVQEMARVVLGERSVDEIVYEDIGNIAKRHARAILEQACKDSKFLFCDTDLMTTKIYSEQYFSQIPVFPAWVEAANQFDHYFFCETDIPWVKDPHRNLGHLRPTLRDRFKEALVQSKVPFTIIRGNQDQRLSMAVQTIESLWL